MKFFLAFALIVAVASADFVKPAPISAEAAEIQEIIAAIHSPSTNPATAAALEELLLDVLGIHPAPVEVGPAIIEQTPVSVGPAIIDFPLPDGGAVPADVVAPSPVVIGPGPVADAISAALVQIIVNINQADGSSPSPVPVNPVVVPEPAPVSPGGIIDVMPVVMPAAPADVVEVMPVVVPAAPVDVVEVMPVVVPAAPVDVVEVMPVVVPAEPVDVIDVMPVVVAPVDPAVVLPEELN